ncbi:MAG: hypothetical protein HY744_19510 [Deltaproteobacteria bacterium]|nr:hypothetical protein [Deltaproteobacteria bacterium]
MTAPHLGAGQVVAGKYTVQSLLGFTGVVGTYQAVDSYGRPVALKLLDPVIGQRADLMSALERVAAVTAELPADCVVPVWDSGYDLTTGAPFSVTELVGIPSLAQHLDRGPIPIDVVARVMDGLARALDAAHARQLFHHALKPSNIFVGPAPAYAVRVADFGASVVRGAVPTQEAYVSAAPWWAPEQLQPSAQLGAQTDVFAAALLAFYSLTARSYWLSCQSMPPDLAAWQREIMGPRVPVTARAQQFGVGLNGALDGVFGRALAVYAAERPQSVGELSAALAQLCGGYAAAGGPRTVALPELGAYPAAPAGGYPPAPAGGGGPVGQSGGYAAAAGGPTGGAGRVGADESLRVAGLPPFPQPAARRPASNKLLPVILGVACALLVGGAAVAFLFMRSPDVKAPRASATAASAASAAANGTAQATASAVATASSSAERTAGAEGTGGGAAKPGEDEPRDVDVEIRCDPPCARLAIDGKEIKDVDAPLKLPPGKHEVEVGRPGHVPQKETIVIEAGKPFEKEYKLAPVAAAGPPPKPPTPPPSPPSKPSSPPSKPAKPSKPCDQFFNPCK